jgi:peptidoglycan-associated lipoprotein
MLYQGRKKLKSFKFALTVVLILGVGIFSGCAKKAVRSDVATYTPSRVVEAKPPEPKPESATPDQSAAAEGEKKLREESLREEDLRQKALREKASQEEAARKAAADREAALKASKLEPVYFEFDQWSVREDQKEVMVKNGEWLKANPNTKVRLEGHCDERGTAEYNLALGQKRADSVKAFLEGLGVSSQRMNTISYGEERPLDPGHNEAAWVKNRRVDIVPVK